MKKLFSILLLVFVTLAVQAQIHQPVKWKIKLEDSKTAEKEIVFTATIEKGRTDRTTGIQHQADRRLRRTVCHGPPLVPRCRNLYTKGKNTRPEEV